MIVAYTIALTVAYLVVLAAAPRWRPPSLKIILLAATLLAIPLLFGPPATSTDVYANGYYGQLITKHGENPYTVSPEASIEDPYLVELHAPHPFRTTYGPLWTSVSAFILHYTGENLPLTVAAFRILLLLSFLLCTILLAALLGKERKWEVAFFAWNPFLLFEFIQNAHNDAAMLLFVLAAFLAYRLRKDAIVLPLIVIAGLVKYTAFFLLPLVIVLILRRDRTLLQRIRNLLLGGGASLAASVLAFFPYWSHGDIFGQLEKLSLTVAVPFYHPLALLIGGLQTIGVELHDAQWIALRFGLGATLTAIPLIAFLAWRKSIQPERGAFFSLLVPPLMSIYFQPWYLAWSLPFGVFLPGKAVRPYLAVVTVVALITATWY